MQTWTIASRGVVDLHHTPPPVATLHLAPPSALDPISGADAAKWCAMVLAFVLITACVCPCSFFGQQLFVTKFVVFSSSSRNYGDEVDARSATAALALCIHPVQSGFLSKPWFPLGQWPFIVRMFTTVWDMQAINLTFSDCVVPLHIFPIFCDMIVYRFFLTVHNEDYWRNKMTRSRI